MNDRKLMYLGPARPYGLPLNSRAVLCGSPERTIPGLSEKFAENPDFRRLFVPVSEIPKARAQLSLEGSPLSIISKKISVASEALKKAGSK